MPGENLLEAVRDQDTEKGRHHTEGRGGPHDGRESRAQDDQSSIFDSKFCTYTHTRTSSLHEKPLTRDGFCSLVSSPFFAVAKVLVPNGRSPVLRDAVRQRGRAVLPPEPRTHIPRGSDALLRGGNYFSARVSLQRALIALMGGVSTRF